MLELRPVHLVVIDDVCRFPLHVWRQVARNIGFGIGDVRDGKEVFRENGELKGLWAPARDVCVWWIDASNADWSRDLEALIPPKIDRLWLFLVDVRGARPGSESGYSV